MTETTERTDPALWEAVKAEVTAAGKGGRKGQWSARKAQMAVQAYRHRGGGYVGEQDDHNSLREWTQQDWGTRSGKASGETGERYLPKAARDSLSDDDYARTTAAKRKDTAAGRQFSAQPGDVADRTREFRDHRTRAQLYEAASARGIRGRSRMTRRQLAHALAT